jgi:peroxiredoxin
MKRMMVAALMAAIVLVGHTQGGGATKLKIGDACPNFSDLPGIDGKKHSLSEYKKDVLVIAITCNHCPVAVGYEDRMIAFAKKFDGKIDFVAVNVNNIAQDKLDKMIARAQEKGFNFAYLYDESQKLGRALNARVTPEFYVFNKKRELVYWGSMDDKQNNPKTNYLDPAVQSTLEGKTVPTATTKAFGCGVKYEK